MTGKEAQIKLTAEEQAFRAFNRDTYNNGRLKEAYEQAAEFFARNPGSLYAKYAYAVMAGDYSEDKSLPETKRRELLGQARQKIKEVCEHRDLDRWELATGARNEGASSMARKCLREGKAAEAKAWAAKAVEAFKEFEKLDPAWFNINPFYAWALAILGDRAGALAAYRDMYRKQNAAINDAEVAGFSAEIQKALNGE